MHIHINISAYLPAALLASHPVFLFLFRVYLSLVVVIV